MDDWASTFQAHNTDQRAAIAQALAQQKAFRAEPAPPWYVYNQSQKAMQPTPSALEQFRAYYQMINNNIAVDADMRAHPEKYR